MEKVLEKTDVLPKGWKVVQLGEIASKIQYGFTESSSDKEVGPKFLRITDIQNNSVDWDAVPYCRISSAKLPEYLLQKGDLLFARTGATVGKSFLIRGSIPEAVFASYLIRVRVRKNMIDEVYLSYFFHSLFYWKQITEGQVGIGQPNVNGTKLKRLVVPLAPLPQQRRIVEAIELQLGRLDAAVAGLVAAKAKLKRYKQAVLKAAFSEGDWPMYATSDVTEWITDGDHQAPPQEPSGIPFIVISNVKNNTIDFSATKYVPESYYTQIAEKRKPKRGDVLYTVTGSYGIPVLVDFDEPFCFQRHIALLRPNDLVLAAYLYTWLQTPDALAQAKHYATGTAQMTVSLKGLRSFELPVPPIEEQGRIVAEVEERLSSIEEMETTLDAQLAQSTRLRQAVLKRAFEGRLV